MAERVEDLPAFGVEPASPSRLRRAGVGAARIWRKWPLGVISGGALLVLVVIAILAPIVAPFDPVEFNRSDRLLSPNGTYLLGTDASGRDQLSRLIHGARISLYVGITPILVSAAIGTILGMSSAYVGGAVDAIIQRLSDALMAIPALVIALTLVALLGPSANNVVIAIAVVTTPAINRVVRGTTLQILQEPYVEAAISLGASNLRMVARHILPNIIAPVIIVGASLVGLAILAEAGLSFLGLGIPPPQPTWGNMLGGDNRNFFEIAPWLAIFPGLAITLTVLAFNLLGDTIRDVLDPRARRASR